MSSRLLPDRIYIPQISNRWGISEKETLGTFLGQDIVFALLENVEKTVFFLDIINEEIQRVAKEQDKDVPDTPKAEFFAFLRVPVLDEYLESIIKKGYWEGIALVHGFEGSEEAEIFDSAIVSSADSSKVIKISLQDLYIEKQALLRLEHDLGLFSDKKPTKKEELLHIRSETTYLNIIGALLEILLGESPNIKGHPSFSSQAQLISHLCDYEVDGLSKSNLEKKFAEAKRVFSAF